MNTSNEVLLTAGRDPGDRTPAPGSLRLVQALVNTLSAEHERDLLATTADATAWLSAALLLPSAKPRLTAAERSSLVALREAIRAVLLANTARREDPEAASRLTLALASCRLGVQVDPAGGVGLVSADHDRLARVTGTLAVAMTEASTAGTWARLKCCQGHLCGWAFYDRSAAGRSVWCSMQLCGARAKMRAYRSRR
jgi:predicted RNA-binding Zn ribbon-like protein